jgi:hypothetical protein
MKMMIHVIPLKVNIISFGGSCFFSLTSQECRKVGKANAPQPINKRMIFLKKSNDDGTTEDLNIYCVLVAWFSITFESAGG